MRLLRPHALVEVAGRQRGRLRPGHLELRGGFHRIPFLLRDNPDEVSLPHNARGGNVLYRAFIDGERLGARAVGALPAGQHHPAVQHVGEPHVLHVHILASHLFRQIDPRNAGADEGVLACRLERRRARDLRLQQLVADEVTVFNRPAGFPVDRHDTLRHD